MLPGQPVSLSRPCRHPHCPGVGVDALHEHLLGQQHQGRHQCPEQEQHAGPQIHERAGVAERREQGVQRRRFCSQPLHAQAPALPGRPPRGPRDHGAHVRAGAGPSGKDGSSRMAGTDLGTTTWGQEE